MKSEIRRCFYPLKRSVLIHKGFDIVYLSKACPLAICEYSNLTCKECPYGNILL